MPHIVSLYTSCLMPSLNDRNDCSLSSLYEGVTATIINKNAVKDSFTRDQMGRESELNEKWLRALP